MQMFFSILLSATVARATVVQFSDLSGLVVPLTINGADLWASLELGFPDSGFHHPSKCPLFVSCVPSADAASEQLHEATIAPNPAWSLESGVMKATAMTDSKTPFGDLRFSWLKQNGASLESPRLLDTAGFVGLGPMSRLAQAVAFRLVRFESNKDLLSLLPYEATVSDADVLASSTVPVLPTSNGWVIPASLELGSVLISHSVNAMIDFSVRDTRIPLSLLTAAHIALTPEDARGNHYIACSALEGDRQRPLRLRVGGGKSIFLHLKRIVDGDGCSTNLRADSGSMVRVGYGLFDTYDDVVFDAHAGTVSVRLLNRVPALANPTRVFQPIPRVERHPVQYTEGGIEFRFRLSSGLTETRYVVKSLDVVNMRFEVVWHPLSPRAPVREQAFDHRYGPLTVEHLEDSTVVVRATRDPEGEFRYVETTTVSGLTIRGIPTGRCPICMDDLDGATGITVLPTCRHRGHEECMRRWAAAQRPPKCPICRAPIAL